MEKITSFFTTLALIVSYIFGFSVPSVEGPVSVIKKDSMVGFAALYAGQGITADEEHYYTSGSIFNQKSGIGLQFLGKWSADGFKREKVNLNPIPRYYKSTYGCGHIGGISCRDGVIYAPVEGTDYSINFIFLFDTEDLSLIEVHNVSREELTDGIPWVAVDEENGYIYTSTWHETDELLRFSLDDFAPADSIKLSESVSRIQGGEFYNGTLYLSKDNSSSTNEDVLAVDITTGQVSVAFTQIMTNYDNEAEDMTVYPRADGSLFHVLNYDKLIGLNIMHY